MGEWKMRRTLLIAAATGVVAGMLFVNHASAGFQSFPRALKPQIERIVFDKPALGPMPYALFCLRHPDDCRVRHMAFRPRPIDINEAQWAELAAVNQKVNQSIAPRNHPYDGIRDTWTISPKYGDCNDYAVTKRHELLERGWPSRALLLAVVRTSWGEGHLVLVVRTRDGDFVLDNLRNDIRAWSQAGYEWIQIQSPRNPNFWSTVRMA